MKYLKKIVYLKYLYYSENVCPYWITSDGNLEVILQIVKHNGEKLNNRSTYLS